MDQSLRTAIIGLLASAAILVAAKTAMSSPRERAKRIEVAFVLDTTGSMEGLIDGAKRKIIWSIANSIVDINPNADIRMGLIGYRDIGDDYVVRTHDMSADIQGLYGRLMKFQADGGGDGPESVNEALDAAVRDLEWSSGDEVRRIVFLVGDAPPHMDYPNGPQYPEILRKAHQNGIIVNAVQVGGAPDTYEFWQDIARLGDGKYFAIPEDGGQVEVHTSPYDNDIMTLQRKIDGTAVPYGSQARQEEVRAKLGEKAAAPAAVQVDNSKFYAKRTSVKEIVTGGGDLLDDLRNKVRDVEDIKADEMPPELKGKTSDEIKAVVAARTAEREKLEAEMAELVKRRDSHIAADISSQPVRQDSFDKQVEAGISAQF